VGKGCIWSAREYKPEDTVVTVGEVRDWWRAPRLHRRTLLRWRMRGRSWRSPGSFKAAPISSGGGAFQAPHLPLQLPGLGGEEPAPCWSRRDEPSALPVVTEVLSEEEVERRGGAGWACSRSARATCKTTPS